MTKKEKLVAELNHIGNMINEIEGRDAIELSQGHVQSLCRNKTVAELETLVRCETRKLERVKEEKRVENYYNTDAGKMVKHTLETQLEIARATANDLQNEAREAVNVVLRERYGERWAVSSHGGGMFDVGLRETSGDGFVFGHKFTFYVDYGAIGECKKVSPAINYGTMGAFNLTDADHVEFLQVLADFAKGGEWLVELCTKQIEYNNRCEAQFSIVRMFRDKLEHPLK